MRNYPKVPRTDVKDTYFGVTIEDPYRYLENKKAPEVLDIVAQENAYTKAFFDHQPEFHWQEVEKRLREKPVHHALSGAGGLRLPLCQSQARRRHARHRYAGRKRSGQRRADE